MSSLDSHQLISFLNRWVHVASMAVIFGGSFLMWAAARRYLSNGENLPGDKGLLVMAKQYEWFFWSGLGRIIVNGVIWGGVNGFLFVIALGLILLINALILTAAAYLGGYANPNASLTPILFALIGSPVGAIVGGVIGFVLAIVKAAVFGFSAAGVLRARALQRLADLLVLLAEGLALERTK